MAIPYFEIQQTDGSANAADIITADSEPKHFVRRRTYIGGDYSDSSVASFDGKPRLTRSVYFVCMRLFAVVFALTLAVSIYFAVAAENAVEGLAIYITTFGLGALFAVFLILFVKEYSFVKSVDDLFIVYGKDGAFCSVEIGKDRARVLNKNTLYVIKRGKVRTVRNERKLYYAYLNMFPASVLNMGKYFDNSDKSYKPVITSSVHYEENGDCYLTLDARTAIPNNAPQSDMAFVPHSRLRHLRFGKFVFTVNDGMKLTAVRSAAQQNAIVGYDILTLAELKESGDAARETLKHFAAANPALGKTLNSIEF